MRAQRLGDLLPHAHNRIERGHRLLEDHGEVASAMPSHLRFRERQKFLPRELDAARHGGRWGKEPQQRERGRRFAGAGLAHKAERLARSDRQRQIVDRHLVAKADRQVGDGQQRRNVHLAMVTKVGAGAARLVPTAASERLIGTMRMIREVGVLLAGAGLAHGVFAQTHRVAKPETVVRAVAVYEWTGDMAKPAASRVVPVTLFIDQHLEDAGIYLARPLPFALLPGDIYELEQAGVPKGNVELVYARHLQATNLAENYDDGWFGYGAFKPLPVPKKPIARKASTQLAKVESSSTTGDAAKPHFSNKSGDPATAPTKADDAKPAVDDSDRPTMKRRNTDDGAPTTASTSTDKSPAPADDPDRPTMKRRADSAPDATSATTTSPAADDPDRPTLKRHTPEDAKKAAKEKSQASVTGAGGLLNEDPDRPNLHRGKPTHMLTETDLPKLSGLPVDLQQMVAVSDATDRPMHDFTRPWDDDAERASVLGKIAEHGAGATCRLRRFGGPRRPSPFASPTASGAAWLRSRSAQVKLLDEKLNGYLLSYGDVPTFVYQAHTDGTRADLRYVTIVAQRDAQGEPALAMHTVTDAAHLDRTARFRLVDAVDVEASNRASLLFEMRGQTSRQFGVYRILGQHAEQIFATGTTQ